MGHGTHLVLTQRNSTRHWWSISTVTPRHGNLCSTLRSISPCGYYSKYLPSHQSPTIHLFKVQASWKCTVATKLCQACVDTREQLNYFVWALILTQVCSYVSLLVFTLLWSTECFYTVGVVILKERCIRNEFYKWNILQEYSLLMYVLIF